MSREYPWPLIVDQNDLADLFAVRVMTLSKWVKVGCPKQKRGKYNVADVIQWRCQQLEERHAGGVKGELLKTQLELKQAELEILRGTLIDLDLHMRGLNEIAVIVASQLDALAARIAFEVVGQSDVLTIQEIVRRETHAIRDAIAAAIDRSADEGGTQAVREDNPAATEQDSGSMGGREPDSPGRRSGTRKVEKQ